MYKVNTYKVKVSKIAELCPLFNEYDDDLYKKIIKSEIQERIESGDLNSEPCTGFYLNYDDVGRIAYLAKNGWSDPIVLDVGIPGLHGSTDLIWDGHHRFAAAVFLELKEIAVTFSGDIDYFNKLFNINEN